MGLSGVLAVPGGSERAFGSANTTEMPKTISTESDDAQKVLVAIF